jgi:maleylacetate reductase
MVSLLAEEAIRALARALPAAVERPGGIGARSEALYGAYLAGVALGAVGMGIHHKLCHVLGGAFDLPHAETHAVILPHAAKYNAGAAPEALGRVARAMGAEDAARGLYDLAKRIGAPLSLAEIGMPEEGIDEAARAAVASPYPNPRPVEFEGVRALLKEAYRGLRP